MSSQLLAPTCAIGTDVPMGTVRLATALRSHAPSHLLTSRLYSQWQAAIAAALSSLVHVPCIDAARGSTLLAHGGCRSLPLLRAWRLRAYCICSACVSIPCSMRASAIYAACNSQQRRQHACVSNACVLTSPHVQGTRPT